MTLSVFNKFSYFPEWETMLVQLDSLGEKCAWRQYLRKGRFNVVKKRNPIKRFIARATVHDKPCKHLNVERTVVRKRIQFWKIIKNFARMRKMVSKYWTEKLRFVLKGVNWKDVKPFSNFNYKAYRMSYLWNGFDLSNLNAIVHISNSIFTAVTQSNWYFPFTHFIENSEQNNYGLYVWLFFYFECFNSN